MDLNFKMAGKGEPVIILHGVFGMLDNWQIVAKNLSDKYWVITIDLRNHGKSPHSDIFNYEVMTDDIVEFMEKHQIISANIIGHSMGGKLAMNLALKYPEKVKKLVVVDIAPKEYPRKHDFIIESLQSLKLEDFNSRKEIEDELLKKIKDIKIIQFLLKNIKRDKNKDFAWKMNLNSIIENYDNINKAIKCDYPFECPTLFIKGRLSDYIIEDDIESIKTLFPNFKLMTLENAGHWVHSEQTEKFIEVLTEFI